ncbi:MAG: TOBE domain-containing protein [Granulosicoccus sp.]|nr:TOBE domain-containing protein [Granulosicoccus sp.]
MSDRIAVMKSGEILQVDTTDTIYDNPATPFVASFVGENNIFRGRIAGVDEHFATIETKQGKLMAVNSPALTAGDEAMLFIRPEKMRLAASGSSHENHLQATFVRRDLEGPFINLFFDCADEEIVVHQTNSGSGNGQASHEEGLYFSAEDAVVMAAGELADE